MAVSPMMQQYFTIKREYPDCILLFRLGDFYEMFYDDAVTASQALELVLTGKDCGGGERAPMCGVPYHAVESYISKLITKGYRVAVCEQLEDPSQSKGIVKRDVVRVVTPGTVTEGAFLAADKNNYICSLYYENGRYGAAYADISTGALYATDLPTEDVKSALLSSLTSYAPSEIITDGSLDEEVLAYLKDRFGTLITQVDKSEFDYDKAEKEIASLTADEDDAEHGPLCLRAVGALIAYLRRTQKDTVAYLRHIHFYSDTKYLSMDAFTKRSLELTESIANHDKRGSLLGAIDSTGSAPGARLLRKWVLNPLLDVEAISARQDAVEELKNATVVRKELYRLFRSVIDMERMTTRIIYNTAGAGDLKLLEGTLRVIPEVKAQLAQLHCGTLRALDESLETLSDVADSIGNTIMENPAGTLKDGNLIRNGANEVVDELRLMVLDGKAWLAKIEQLEKERTGIRTLKVGYNKVFGYYIEVSKSFAGSVPSNYIRRQTLANSERYVTDELKDMESRILSAKERLFALEYEIFQKLREVILQSAERIKKAAAVLAELDVYTSFATTAADLQMVRPLVDDSDGLSITEGRHIVVEKHLKKTYFVPNDCRFDGESERLLLITGPNMAGKSTYMRQVALIVLLAQIGSFVPAAQAHIGLADKIFTRVGASDDLAGGSSTFMLEMSEVATILRSATKRSLIVYDEIGRGTSTFDGMSIARAVMEYTVGHIGARTLFATHYHELTALEGACPGVVNYNIAAKKRGGEIIFLRKIVRGAADESYGIEVASLAGVPKEVVGRAREILSEIETDSVRAVPRPAAAPQVSAAAEDVLDRLRALNVETITPIEAMSILYELKNASAAE